MGQNSEIQIMTKLKNSNCCKTQKLKLGQNSKLKLWPNSKTQIVTKQKKSNCDKTQKLKLRQNINYDKSQFMTKDILEWSVSKSILTPWQPMRCSLSSFLQFSQCFHICPFKLSKSTIRIFNNFFTISGTLLI